MRSGISAEAAPLLGNHLTLAEAFTAAADQFAEHDAYVDNGRRITFRQWYDDAERLAGTLAEHGVREGDVVAIWLTSSIEFAVALGAIILLGAVPTGINTRLGAREVAAIRTRATPKLWLTEDALDLPGHGIGNAKIEDGKSRERRITRTDLMTILACADRRPLPPLHVAREDPAVIIWTSGTTGLPKGAWFDHANLESAVRLAGPMTTAFDRRLAPPVFAHAAYLAKLWEQCAFGMALIVPPTPWSAAAALQLIVDERVTTATGVPTQWDKLLKEPCIADADFSNLRICIAASAPMPPDLTEALNRRLRTDVLIRYAMTECPTIAGTSPDDDLDLLYHTVGRPLPGIEVEVRDAGNRAVAAGTLGRIAVRAPCMMRGYWNAPEETKHAFTPDGWMLTSDIGSIGDDGRLSLAGRTSEMYIRGGYNVYPIEIENALAEHPQVARAAVIGIPAASIGEIGVACIIPTDHAAPPSLAELRAWTKARLADYKAPDRVEIFESLPVTAMMKVDKLALREILIAPNSST